MNYEEYSNRVHKIAMVKYELNEDVMEAFEEQILKCYENEFTPLRTVEFIAERVF